MVSGTLFENMVPIQVKLPYQQGQLISLFHETGQVERVEHGRNGVSIQGRIPGRLLARYRPWIASAQSKVPQDIEDERIEEEEP
jgi:GTP-binding protein HflX